MSAETTRAGLTVASVLADFIEQRALIGTGIDAELFWQGLAAIFTAMTPRNRALLARRDEFQAAIDARYAAGERVDDGWLRQIGYLVPEPAPFTIETGGVDPEVARMAGPQLVVPALNARFVLNAANARWGSLYDALYGTDVLPGTARAGGYDAARGAQVIAYARAFLDRILPGWLAALGGGDHPALVARNGESPVFLHHGLHIEVVVDSTHPIGASDPDGIADVLVEAALSTIVDLEDSVAAVDAEDKVAAYANWLGLMRGDLEERFEKGGQTITRRLNADRHYVAPDGSALTLPGRSLLFVRNVGHLMTTPAVRLPDGEEAPEGILDAIVTSLIGLHDLKGEGAFRNSRTGSIYIV